MAKTKKQAARILEKPMALGYRPTAPYAYGATGLPTIAVRRDLEFMAWHPIVKNALQYFKAGIALADFEVHTKDSRVEAFVQEQCRHFWAVGRPKVQNLGYKWGWMGGENIYDDSGGVLRWDKLIDYSPADTYLLTREYQYAGVRVKNVPNGPVDLWGHAALPDADAGDEKQPAPIPAKAYWYAHLPQCTQWYGQTQFAGAWLPWRRLCSQDGAEQTLDMGFYRFAYSGPIVRFPENAYRQGQDNQGGPSYQFARDEARQMAEQTKAGASFAFPSTRDKLGNYIWDLIWPDHGMPTDNMIIYVKHLYDQVNLGIGVPPELITAGETGSGYSGRAIPLEGFLMQQQEIGDLMLSGFDEQVLRSLVWWNFGPVKYRVKLKPLLETKAKAVQAISQQPQAQPQPNPGQPQSAPAQNGNPFAQGNGQAQMSLDARLKVDELPLEQTKIIAGKILEAAREYHDGHRLNGVLTRKSA